MQGDSSSQLLDVATPERVALKLPVAGIGYRALAYLVDAGAMFFFWIACWFAASFATDLWESFKALSGLGQALALFGVFAAQWCYWTLFEIFWNGQTPGKRLLRIRVVRMDGAPVTPLESVLRNLFRFLDFLPLAYAAGLISMLATRESRRLGDLVAGTVLVKDERVDLSRYAPPVAPVIGSAAPVSALLAADEHELLLAFLQRAPTMESTARAALSLKFARHYGRGLDEEGRARVSANAEAAESFLRQLSEAQARA